ncbi:hypothetical protein [Cellulosimicrobium composti]|uniref:Uncharacterized protein n=1 Tax=Cellulosimicrobium composti TaxID=2672572 RepID=A0A6N7ZEY6_9MICO|nr:hypothetical protein [Cellulosimicrobium composti]MTG87889.1 hypothetical protein [Cellulosimicrobium composti]NDO88156.1 hypothetical protein [Cellulosimicrobium composti]TWG74809.1 hypothetical protein L603_000900000660 [Cellulosimicrobium cellulans J34]SMF17561.1 hypothetical protein SAMN02744115_01806 [Cellulosimicrobium cellulans J1]
MRQSLSETIDRRTAALAWAGLALTVLAAAYPVVDRATTGLLADHVRAGYPAYGTAEVDAAVTAYVAILAVVGVLGVVGWLLTLRAARTDARWGRWLAAGLLVAGAGVALAGLTVVDTSGDVGLAPALAWLLVLPCLPGLAVVALLWRRPS